MCHQTLAGTPVPFLFTYSAPLSYSTDPRLQTPDVILKGTEYYGQTVFFRGSLSTRSSEVSTQYLEFNPTFRQG